jgi:hypothetical protein
MLFFIVPFFWMLAVPVIFLGILLIRALFWLRSTRRVETRHPDPSNPPFIEGEFIDAEDPDEPGDGSSPSRGPLEK